MSHFLGLDVSTTATKALVMDGDGQVVSVASAEYGYETPRPMWTEQRPDLWWEATIAAIDEAMAKASLGGTDVVALGLSGQMHGMVLLDDHREVLRPAILWNDQRTEAQVDVMEDLIGREQFIEITGNPPLTGFTAPKLLWTRDHEPEVWKAARHLLLPKDFVRLKLSGTLAIDAADASGTSLLDLSRRQWSETITDALDIPLSMLPRIAEGPDITGEVSGPAAEATGLREGVPIVAGGGDQAANGVGVGAVTEGVVAISLGTSGVVFTSTHSPLLEPEARLHSFCHAVPETWHLMGVTLSAAGSYRWFRDSIAPERAFPELDEEAGATPMGAGGLIFLPYLTGERTPYADPRARGAFVGLTVRHGRGEMARSVLEGVAFGLRDSFELMRGLVEIDEIRISGGGSRSSLWNQIIADVFDRPATRIATEESAAHGAAMLSAAGVGAFGSVSQVCNAAVRFGETYEPGMDRDIYEENYGIFRGLYPSLRESLHDLSGF